MLKKIVIGSLVFALLVTSAFAAEDASGFSFSAGVTLPQTFNLKPEKKTFVDNITEDIEKEKYSSFGLTAGFRAQFADFGLGFFLDADLYWPLKFKQETENHTLTYDLSDSKMWGIEGALGIYYPIINTGFLTIPLGVGVHVNYSNRELDVAYSASKEDTKFFSLGLAAFINLEFAVTDSIALFGGVRVGWDFYAYTTTKRPAGYTYETEDSKGKHVTVTDKTTKDTDSGKTSMLYLTPVIGILIRF